MAKKKKLPTGYGYGSKVYAKKKGKAARRKKAAKGKGGKIKMPKKKGLKYKAFVKAFLKLNEGASIKDAAKAWKKYKKK